MASKAAHKRLTKEYVAMQKEPPPFVWAVPDEKNILHWNYIIRGPPDSPYHNGEYHGIIMFPSEYPFKPPGIKMLTPSGRFQPDKKICFSMSDFHPGSWNPAWSVATILTGLLSFMLADEMTTGSVTTSVADKRAYAARSHEWNTMQKKFRDAFPDHCGQALKDLPNMAQRERGMVASEPIQSSDCPSSSAPASSPVGASGTSACTGTQLTEATNRTEKYDAVAKDASDAPGDALGWGQVIWDKWRWGVLIALAVLVSRFSSNT